LSSSRKEWQVSRLVVGDLMVNCYLVMWKATREAVIIDPGDEPEQIIDFSTKHQAKITAIINTHGHGDHIGGNSRLKTTTQAPILIGAKDAPMLTDALKNLSRPFGFDVLSPPADRLLNEGDSISIGAGRLEVLETPGHSPGSITLVGDEFAIVGDLLFEGSIGRTDFPGGSEKILLESVRKKIFPLGDECLILPGHGATTTVGAERRSNPFLQVFLKTVMQR